ncbi:MAG: hypothetical protein A2Y25_01985 [Candidatus Melainabacteria bacterium GWF2_37_15]|nr:MAG: hypothetical protein A2Y25_01985 [Candidatus Melainabacteria bacterium GWF2_37_15]
MSLVSLMAMQLANTMRASNAEMSIISAQNQILGGVRQAGNPNLSFTGMKELHDRENNLVANMLTANLVRQASNAQQESIDKMLKDNIKRSFSIMA